MASRKEIEDQIAALQAEADSMGEEEEFDVEIWNEKGEGARLPHGQTTRWLREKFPDLFEPDPDPDESDNSDSTDKVKKSGRNPTPKSNAPSTGPRNGGTAQRYFGKRQVGK